MPYFGLQIIESLQMVNRKQNRTHRRRRINKKWAKRYGFTVTPKKEVFVFENKAIMHPSVASVLRKQIGGESRG